MSHSGRSGTPADDDTARFGSWRHRARYRFDNLLARGTWATLLWLGAITLAAILVSSVLLTIAGVNFTGAEGDWLEDAWQSLLRVLDPGTMAGDVGWGQRVLALGVTVFGILVAGTLIGIIASGVEDRIDRMRRGRSVVIESDHVVVLGSSDQLPSLVEQLLRVPRGGGPPTVVVLADEDPAHLDRRIRAVVRDRHQRVVVRSGDPTRQEDLALVRLSHAAGVVVLAESGGGDTWVAETVLAVGRAAGGTPHHPVVAEVGDPTTAARLVAACGSWVHPLATGAALARSAAFALRQPGMGLVLDELLQPGNCELFVRPADDVAGMAFEDLLTRWTNARAIGVVRPDGHVALNPPVGTVVGPADSVALIVGPGAFRAAPTETSQRRPTAPVRRPLPHPDRVPEHLLVVGWSAFGVRLLAEWARWAAPSSTVEIVVGDHDGDAPGLAGMADVRVTRASSLTEVIDERGGLPGVTTVLLLASDRIPAPEADVDTLLDLGIIQRTRGRDGPDHPRVVVQVRDLSHAQLVALEGRHDWLITPGLASPLLAQLVRQPARRDVLLALYDEAATSTLELFPADALGLVGTVDVADVVATAWAHGMLAVGHLLVGPSRDVLALAPPLDAAVQFGPDDHVVVVA